MPRKSRIDAPGALQHIIIRGIERRPVFKHHKDYRDFRTRLGNIVVQTQASCFAWPLMVSSQEVSRQLHLSPTAVSKLANRGRMDGLVNRIRDDVLGSIYGPADQKRLS